MNPFEEMLTSEIRLIKPSGDVLGPFKAFVQDSEIYFFEVHHPVSTGDKIVRELPNGMKETYEVENAEYEKGLPPDLPPCYKLHVRKEDDQTRNKTLSSTNIFNVKGDFSRVNFQSLDNSVNIQDRPENGLRPGETEAACGDRGSGSFEGAPGTLAADGGRQESAKVGGGLQQLYRGCRESYDHYCPSFACTCRNSEKRHLTI